MASKLLPSPESIMSLSLREVVYLIHFNSTAYQMLISSLENVTARSRAEACFSRLLALYTSPASSDPSKLNTLPVIQINTPPATHFNICGNEILVVYHTEPNINTTLYCFKEFDLSHSLFYYVRLHFLLLIHLLTR